MPYAPAGNTTQSPGLTHAPAAWYSRNALDQLLVNFRFAQACETDTQLPQGNGRTVQMYRYGVLGSNTTPSAEGVIGTSVAQSTTTVSATIQEYSDFTSGSTLLVETDISQVETSYAKNLGYRAGLSNDTLARTEFDSNVSSVGVLTISSTATVQDVRSAVTSLKAINVQPKMDSGDFMGILHPYIVYDIQADNTAGGFIEMAKYSQPEKLMNCEIGKVGQTRFVETTNVGTTGSSPNVLYYTYVIGKGSVGSIPLAGRAPSMISDPKKQNFNVAVVRGGKPAIYDPTGTIGFVASYRFVQVYKTLDSTNYRYKIIKCDASLV